MKVTAEIDGVATFRWTDVPDDAWQRIADLMGDLGVPAPDVFREGFAVTSDE